ncbi:protein of unknown function [Candidatus Promineifilum breve]|uniref:Uncharacterized protein n=1 Tax=Candidatus Promineifilum breve TaxID=1806508 RepID=A0A160T306_9CHLR|nr:protein of unknown function [Candidatus Promineifilum breve]
MDFVLSRSESLIKKMPSPTLITGAAIQVDGGFLAV